jgi:hypothetical protein
VAFGAKQVKPLVEANSTRLFANSPQSKQVGFISVSLESSNPGPILALFSNQQSVGNNAIPARLFNSLGDLAGVSFEQVLLPGDELHARAAIGSGSFSVIISVSYF